MQTKLNCFSAQNHPLAEDFNTARFSIDQISLLVKKNGIDKTNRLTQENRRDGEQERQRLHVVSRNLKLQYHQLLCQLHIKCTKYSKVQHTAHFL